MPLELHTDGFSFHDPAIGGWRHIGFSLNGRRCGGGQLTAPDRLVFVDDAIEQTITFEHRPDTQSLIVTRQLRNGGAEPLAVRELSDGMLDAQASVGTAREHEYNAVYLHTDNSRTERYPDSRPEYPYIRPVPYAPVTLGRGEANAFPALVLGDLERDSLLVEGDLDQTGFLRSWQLGVYDTVGTRRQGVIGCYRAMQTAPLSAGVVLPPGEARTVSTVFYQLRHGAFQDAFDDYIRALEARHTFAAPVSSLRHAAVYCTWNYGTLHEIDERLLATRARILADHQPDCRWFLIDDGYQQDRNGRNGPLDCFYPEPARRYDRDRFPAGMQAMADTIRAAGLRPAIWLSPTVYLDSPLAREHPDWLLRDRDGHPGPIGGRTTWLDLSVPPAREFFLRVLDALFVEWGFEGVKFDFMTQWFSLEKACFREHDGLYWRDWVFREIRRRIGPDGLFMTCIAMSMGNPFPGRYADCYRCGCDIHNGTWAEQRKACRMTLPQILLEGRRTGLLNMDSAGFGHVPEPEQLFRLTWVFITQGLIELGGPVERFEARHWARWAALLRHCDRGHRVRCLDERALTGEGFPELLQVVYPAGSRMARAGVKAHIACFNFSERTKPVGGDRATLGIGPDDRITDYWSGEPCANDPVQLAILPPHAARLLEIRPPAG